MEHIPSHKLNFPCDSQIPKQQYKISCRTNRVYDIAERKVGAADGRSDFSSVRSEILFRFIISLTVHAMGIMCANLINASWQLEQRRGVTDIESRNTVQSLQHNEHNVDGVFSAYSGSAAVSVTRHPSGLSHSSPLPRCGQETKKSEYLLKIWRK